MESKLLQKLQKYQKAFDECNKAKQAFEEEHNIADQHDVRETISYAKNRITSGSFKNLIIESLTST